MTCSSIFLSLVVGLLLSASVRALLFPKKAIGLVSATDAELESLDVSKFQRIAISGNFSDCHALRKIGHQRNGVYNVYINGSFKAVGCYFTKDAAWTIIQQRIKGDVSFDQRLVTYANGFGSVQGDHWMGLNTIRHLVELGNNQLQIVLTSWAPQTATATYGYFSIGTQSQGWPISVGSFYGSVPDDLSYSNGRVFYTSDVPDPNSCALNQHGGWWYNYCSYAFLNGKYYYGGRYTPPGQFYDGIYWKDWLGYDYSLKQVTMAVSHK